MVELKGESLLRFAGQIAIVTGGANGIGRAIAERLATEGATVALFDRDSTRLSTAVTEMASAGHVIRGYETDVADEISVQNSIQALRQELGVPGIMVNCAGIVGPTNTSILDFPVADFDKIYGINLRGSYLMTKYVLSLMVSENYGRILLVASIAGKEGNPGMCGYSATKAGVIGLVKGVAKEFAESEITVNGLAPAVVMTDLVRGAHPVQVDYMTSRIPMKRCGTLEEVASLAAFIVSKECSFCTGFVFDLSGGRATY